MKQFTLVKTNFNHHVSMDLYYEFESRIIIKPNWEIISGVRSIQARVLRQLLKFIPPIQLPIKKHKNYVVIGYQKEKFFPFFHYISPFNILLFTFVYSFIKIVPIRFLKYFFLLY